jgi:hypothetical protein
MVSTMRFLEIAEQLDTGTVLALKAPTDGWPLPAGTAGDYAAADSSDRAKRGI